VVVGCGFGGLSAVKALREVDVDVTVIDRTNHHLFQPLLYQLATGILSEGDIAPPIRDVLRRQRNAEVLLAEVVAIDPGARRLEVRTVERSGTVEYDSLIVAAGARSSYFGHDEFAEHAPGMKTLEDAFELRSRIFGAFELAEQEADPQRRSQWLTFVVVGAGPTGVEMAGQIVELSKRSLHRNFRHIDPAAARVVLLDAGSKVLGEFPPSLQRRALRDLERLGIEVHLETMVLDVDAAGVTTNATDPAIRRIEAATKFWAAGVRGSALGEILAQALGAELGRGGRLEVQPDCTVPGHPEIFVVGDLMSLDGLPGVAEVAMQSGTHAARLIERRLRGEDASEPFRYRDLGSMATISRFRAIAAIGPVRTSGFIGWLIWLFVHLLFLTGFKNRVAVLANWTIAFIGRGRPQRVISSDRLCDAALRRPREVENEPKGARDVQPTRGGDSHDR
jgi:NADH dehydrogenase